MKAYKKLSLFLLMSLFAVIVLWRVASSHVYCWAKDFKCNQYCGLEVNCEKGSCFCSASYGEGCYCFGECQGQYVIGGKD